MPSFLPPVRTKALVLSIVPLLLTVPVTVPLLVNVLPALTAIVPWVKPPAFEKSPAIVVVPVPSIVPAFVPLCKVKSFEFITNAPVLLVKDSISATPELLKVPLFVN